MNSISFMLAYAICGSLGLTLIKKCLNATSSYFVAIQSPTLIVGICLYGFSFILWLKILKKNELSYAFPVASAALFIFISVFSSFILNEHLSYTRIAGMGLISIGILIVSRG